MAAARRRRMGDRKEGRLLRSLPGFAKFIPFIMPQRNDRLIHYEESFEVTELDRCLRKLRVEGYPGIGMLHFLIAAYVRGLSMLPGANRFVAGRRIYARNNIEIIMTVKRSLSVGATETTIKVVFEPTDTILDVYRKMNEAIDEVNLPMKAAAPRILPISWQSFPAFCCALRSPCCACWITSDGSPSLC